MAAVASGEYGSAVVHLTGVTLESDRQARALAVGAPGKSAVAVMFVDSQQSVASSQLLTRQAIALAGADATDATTTTLQLGASLAFASFSSGHLVLAVGAPGAQSKAGAVVLLRLTASGGLDSASNLPLASQGSAVTTAAGEEFGAALAFIPALSGKIGAHDLVVGAPGFNSASGAVYLFQLDEDTLELASPSTRIDAADRVMSGGIVGVAEFGASLASLEAAASSGFEGCVRRVVAVGSPSQAVGGGSGTGAGRVWLLRLNATGVEDIAGSLDMTSDALKAAGAEAAWKLGLAVAAASDRTGIKLPDLFVTADRGAAYHSRVINIALGLTKDSTLQSETARFQVDKATEVLESVRATRIAWLEPGLAAGASLSASADFNGDGLAEVIVGIPSFSSAAGSSIGLMMSLAWTTLPDNSIPVADANSFVPDDEIRMVYTGTSIGSGAGGLPTTAFDSSFSHKELFGSTTHVTCDLDKDGVRVMLVTAPGFDFLPTDPSKNTDEGAVYVLLMHANNTVKAWNTIRIANDGPTGEDGVNLVCSSSNNCAGAKFGYRSVKTIGDLDADGNCEVAVSTYNRNSYQVGGVLVMFMNQLKADSAGKAVAAQPGFRLVKKVTEIFEASSTWSYTGVSSSDYVGHSIAAPGDIDGDGIEDLVVGAPGTTRYYSDAGAVYVWALNADASVKSHGEFKGYSGGFNEQPYNDAQFGFDMHEMEALDHTTDGTSYPSVVIGSPYDDRYGTNMGRAYTVKLASNLQVKEYHIVDRVTCGITEFTSNALWGYAFAPLGDVNNDGGQDLAVLARDVDSIFVLLLNRFGACITNTALGYKAFSRSADAAHSFPGWSSFAASKLEGISPAPSLVLGDVTKPLWGKSSNSLWVADVDWKDPSRANWATGMSYMVRVLQTRLERVVNHFSQRMVSFSSSVTDFIGYSPQTLLSTSYQYTRGVKYLGDWDGDGNGDIVFGAPQASSYYSYSGMAYLVLLDDDGNWGDFGSGRHGESYKTAIFANNQGGFSTNWPSSSYGGWSFATRIDLDGDGTEDLVSSMPYYTQVYTQTGGLMFITLQKKGNVPWRKSHAMVTPYTMGAMAGKSTPTCFKSGGHLGFGIENAGDLNNDGMPDIIATAGTLYENSLFVLFLQASTSDSFVKDWVELVSAAKAIDGVTAPSGIGGPNGLIARFSASSDFFGDGNPDFAIGSAYHNPAGYSNLGAVWIISVGDEGTAVKHSTLITRGENGGPESLVANDLFGSGVAAIPDQDGDGLEDLLVGAIGFDVSSHSNVGAVFMFQLNEDASFKEDFQIISPTSDAAAGKLGWLTSSSYCGAGIAAFPLHSSLSTYEIAVTCRHSSGHLQLYRPKVDHAVTEMPWAPRWRPLASQDYATTYESWPVTAKSDGTHQVTSHSVAAGSCFSNVLTLNYPLWATDTPESQTMSVRLMPRPSIPTSGGLAWRALDSDNYYYASLSLATPQAQEVWAVVNGQPRKLGTFVCDLVSVAAKEQELLATLQVKTWSSGLHQVFCGQAAVISGKPTAEFKDTSLRLGNGVGLWSSAQGGNVDFDDFSVEDDCPSYASCGNLMAGQTCEFTCASGFRQVPGTDSLRQCSDSGSWLGTDLRCAASPPTFEGEQPPFTREVPEQSVPDTPIGNAIEASTGASQTAALWRIVSGNGPDDDWFAIGRCDGQLRVLQVELEFAKRTEYVLSVGVSADGDPDAEVVATVTIRVTDVNNPPAWTGDAPEVQFAEDAEVGTLAGVPLLSLVSDPDGDTPTFIIISGDLSKQFEIDAATSRIRVRKALDYETSAFALLQVRAMDEHDETLFADAVVRIQVQDVNEPPRFVQTTGTILELAQGRDLSLVNASELVLVTQPVATDDGIGQKLNYSLLNEDGFQSDVFVVGADEAGAIKVSVRPEHASKLDFETIPLLRLKVRATDNGLPPLHADAVVVVHVTNLNEAPVVTWPAGSLPVAENAAVGTVVHTFQASDPDVGQQLSWSVSRQSVPGAFRAVMGAIEVKSATSLDFESGLAMPMWVEVTVADNGMPQISATRNVTMVLTDVNEAPSVVAGQSFTISESSAVGTVVGQVQVSDPDASDAGHHTLLATGDQSAFTDVAGSLQLVVSGLGSLDFETKPSHRVDVKVFDQGGLWATGSVTVIVTDANEPPAFARSSVAVSIGQDSAAGTEVVRLLVSDPDGDDAVTVSITSGDGKGDFAVDSDGILTVKHVGGGMTVGLRQLTVQASDKAGLSSSCVVQLTVVEQNDAPTASDTTRSVSENAAVGTLVGDPIAASDGDGDAIRFSFDASQSAFAIDSVTGQIRVASAKALDFEASPSLSLRVRITDDAPQPLSVTITVLVSLLDVNEAPSLTAGQTLSVGELDAAGKVLGTITASDPDANDALSFSIVSGASGGIFTIDATTGSVTLGPAGSVNFEQAATHSLTVRVTDAGRLKAEGSVSVVVGNANDAPSLPDTLLRVPESAAAGSLLSSGLRATDEDAGSELTFSLGATSPNEACWASSPIIRNSVMWSPFLLDATAEDEDVRVVTAYIDATDDVQVALGAQGATEAPASPTGDHYVVHMRTAASASAGSRVLRCSGTPAQCSLLGSSQVAMVNRSQNGALGMVWVAVEHTDQGEARIIAGSGAFDQDSLTDNSPLVLAVDPDPITATRVGVLASADGTRFTGVCHMSSSASASARFTVDSATGSVRVKEDAPALDFETSSVFGMLVRVTDNGQPAKSTVGVLTIQLEDVNESPKWVMSNPTCGFTGRQFDACLFIPEGSVAGTAATGNLVPPDPDSKQLQTVSLSLPLGDAASIATAAKFALDGSELKLKAGAVLDHESEPLLELRVVATDSGVPSASSSGLVAVVITDVNEVPQWDAETLTRFVEENSAAGAKVGSPLFATDPDAGDSLSYSIVAGGDETTFELDAATPGQLLVAPGAVLDFERQRQYTIAVRATDKGGRESTASITVALVDVNERPVIAATTRSVPENSPSKTNVGAAIAASDPDQGQSLSFAITSGPAGIFTIDRCSGQLQVQAGASLDHEDSPQWTLTVTVTDDGSPTPLSASAQVVVSVDDVNEPPMVSAVTISIDESAVAGANVGTALVAKDPDAGDSVVLKLTGGNAAGLFALDSASGQLSLVRAGLDYETAAFRRFDLDVQATDSKGVSATARVVVLVLDVNEAPVVQTQFVEASERTDTTPLAAGDAVGAPVVATDPEGGQVRFSVMSSSRSGDSLFTIDATTGQLRVTAVGATAMDFEANQTLQASVTASDSGTPPQASSQVVVVRVLNVNEAPMFGFTTRRVDVSEGASPGAVVLTGSMLGASDPETPDASDLKFAILSGNQQGLWSMDAVGGHLHFAQSNTRSLDFETMQRQSTLLVSVTDNGVPDGTKRSSTATLQVFVLDVNEPPSVVLPVAGLEVRESSAAGASVGSVSCADADANDQGGLKLALVSQDAIPGSGGVLPFVIDADTGVLRVRSGAGGSQQLDAESKSTYMVQLQCADNLGKVSETVMTSVRVVDVNEPPACSATQSFSAAEGVKAMVGTPLGSVCSDPDSGDVLTFAIEQASLASAPAFAVDANSGQLRVHDVSGSGTGSVNDASARFELNVTVADQQGLTTVVRVFVQMTDTNDPPSFHASVPTVLSVPESSGDGFVVALMQATDEDFTTDQAHRLSYSLAATGRSVNRPFPFAISTKQGATVLGAGEIVLKLQGSGLASLDFEGAQSEFDAIVTATDNGSPQLSSSVVVTIRVTDVAESPSFDAIVANSSPDVDSATGLPVIRLFVTEGLKKDAVAFAVAASDLDAASQGHLEWALSAPTSLFSELFSLEQATGDIKAAQDIDFEAIAARAGVGLASGQALSATIAVGDANEGAGLTTSAVLRVSVTDVNEPPVVAVMTALEVAEDASSGSSVGTIAAADPDSGFRGQLRFRINATADDDGASFRIDPLTGTVSIASAGLDWEDQPEFHFQVVVQDSDSFEPLQVSTMVTVSVLNVNDVKVTAVRLDPGGITCTSSPCPQGATLADMVSRPGLESMSSTGIFFSPLGGATVQLVGSGIGFTAARLKRDDLSMADVEVAVTYGPTGTEYVAQSCNVVVAGTVVQCLTVAAWGGKHKWRLEVTNVGQTSLKHACDAPGTTSAMPPQITGVSVSEHSGQLPPGQMPTYGGASFSIEGLGFGPKGSTISLTLGGPDGQRFSVQFCTVTSDGQNLAQCFVAPAGLGKNLLFSAVVSGLPSAVFQSTVSYAPPDVTSVVVKDQASSSVTQSTLRTRGGQVLVVTGSQLSDGAFPDELQLRYGAGSGDSRQFKATQCRVTKPHTELQCMSVAGVGFGLAIQAQVGGQWSEASTVTLSYASPIVSSVSGAGALASDTAGGETLSVVGDNFGPADTSLASVLVSYGPAANPSKYVAHSCRYGAANTEIVCLTAPGTGRAHGLFVKVASQTSALLANAVSYEAPVVAFYEGAGSADAATDGMQEVRVTGRNFGPVGHGAIDLVVYRQPTDTSGDLTPTDLTALSAVGTQWNNWTDVPSLDTEQFVFRAGSCRVSVAHVQLSCLTAEGAGRGMQWAAVVDGQASTVPSTSYGAPRLDSIAGVGTAGATTDGGEDVVLRGANFGPSFELAEGGGAGFLSSVTYGPSRREYMAQACKVVSHSEIQCRTSAGVGRSHRWRVVVGGQETADYRDSTDTRAAGLVLDYAAPLLSSVSPLTGSTEGGFSIRLSGTNLGLSDARRASSGEAVMTVLFGDLQLPVVAHSSDGTGRHSVDVYVPESDGGAHNVQVSLVDPAGRTTVSNTFAFAFGSPALSKELYVVLTVGSRFNITATGTNFGLAPRILVNGVPTEGCDVVVPHRQVTCQFEGRSGDVSVITRSGVVSNTVFFDFISPSFLVGDVSGRPLLDTKGGTVIRVEGLNWQTDPSQINVTVGGAPCPIMPLDNPVVLLEDEAENRFSLECLAPPGQGQGVPVVINRGGQASLPDSAWSYAPPSLVSVDPATSLPTTGGSITIRGSNFGLSGVVLLPGISVQVQSWSHDTIVALVAAGGGAALGLEVDVAQQRSEPMPFSFAPPLITQAPATGPTVGQTGVVITGQNFGVSMPTLSLTRSRLDASGLPQSLPCEVVSSDHTRLVVNLPEGTGTGWRVVVSAAGQGPTSPPMFDFERPGLSRVEFDPLAGLPTAGGVEITAVGANLGPSGAVLFIRAFGDSNPMSGYQATWLRQTHATATFVLPEGQGSTLEAVITVDGQHSDPLPFAFDPPRIDSLLLPDEVPTEGTWRSRTPVRHDVVTIMGASFGVQSTQRTEVRILPAAANVSAAFLAISADDFRKGEACTLSVEPDPLAPGKFKETESGVRNYGHDMIRAGIPEGYGRDLRLVVSVGGRLSNAVLFSYDPPAVTAAMPNVPAAATCPQDNAVLGTCASAGPQGQSIRLTGRNFGETPPLDGELDIRIGGLPCSAQSWNRDATLSGRPYLTCSIPWDTVGAKNLTVGVALQAIEPWSADEGLLASECAAGAYGVEGEFCLECPVGASCAGGEADPVSLPGWFDVRPGLGANDTNKADDVLCPMQRRVLSARDFCFHPMPCEPKEACIGASLCATGYSGERCSQCETGRFYRINGLCERCPDSPGLIVALFVVVALAACVAGYVLNQRSVNVGLLAVGVDYFQVLAIFARTRVNWPGFVRDLFRWLSAFNLNLELAAPECVLPEMTFALKWFMTMLLPLAAVIVLGLTFGAQLLYKRVVMGRRDWRELTSHLDPLVAVMVVVGVFLYLVLSRMTLDVFNCAPTDPPDGDNLYMSGMLDIVCFQSESHLLLFPFAVTAAVLYVAGFPAFVFMFVRRNLYKVKYDQILRARGISPSSKLMPPQIKAFRSRWHRLYYLYRPGKAYWLVVILARKFLVAFTALAFRSTPTYQLAASIVVLFAAFTLQVRHSPYMSLSDHEAVTSQFRDFTSPANMKAEGTLQLAIRSNMDDFELTFEAEGKRGAGGKWGAAASEVGKAKSVLKARATSAIAEQLVNYNAVEVVLLGCGILVNLAGIMFLSERFADSYNGYYQAEYDTLAVVVGLVIFASLVFFVGTLTVEVMHVATPATAARVFGMCISAKRVDKRLANTASKHALMVGAGGSTTTAPLRARGGGGGAGAFEMVNNPASSALDLASDGIRGSSLPEELPDQEMWSSVRANYRRNERQLKELRATVSKMQDEAKRVDTIASMSVRLPSLADALADGKGGSRRSPTSQVSSPTGTQKRRLRFGARSPHLGSRRSSATAGSDISAPTMELGSPALPAFDMVTAPPPKRATSASKTKL